MLAIYLYIVIPMYVCRETYIHGFSCMPMCISLFWFCDFF